MPLAKEPRQEFRGAEGVFTGPWGSWLHPMWPLVLALGAVVAERGCVCAPSQARPRRNSGSDPRALTITATRSRFESHVATVHVADAACGSQGPEVMFHGRGGRRDHFISQRGMKSCFITEDKVPSPISCQGRRPGGQVPKSSGNSLQPLGNSVLPVPLWWRPGPALLVLVLRLARKPSC